MIYEYYEPWLDEWRTRGRLTVDHHNGVTTVLAWEPNQKPKFHDALTGQKRELNQRVRSPTPEGPVQWCRGLDHGHTWDNEADDQCACKVCGATIIFVRAGKNLKEKLA